MEKMIKVVMVILAVVTVVGFTSGVKNGNISLDFENSGSVEWFWEPDVILDFENSGSVEWFWEPDVILSADFNIESLVNHNFNKTNGFKNSGLPETIDIEIVCL